jgi:hypothetical protein
VISRLVASFVTVVAIAGAMATTVLADATPVQLVLIYMPNVSNTGTTSASGIAELVMPEGEVRITAADLPRLDSDKQYVAWVVNTETNDFQRLAAFNTAESSRAVHFESVLADAIPNHHWNLLLVTVEENGQASRPSSQHSIAGVFPSPDNAPLPIALPNTGGEPAVSRQPSASTGADWLAKSGLAALTLGVGAVAGYVVGRRRGLRNDQPLTPNC